MPPAPGLPPARDWKPYANRASTRDACAVGTRPRTLPRHPAWLAQLPGLLLPSLVSGRSSHLFRPLSLSDAASKSFRCMFCEPDAVKCAPKFTEGQNTKNGSIPEADSAGVERFCGGHVGNFFDSGTRASWF